MKRSTKITVAFALFFLLSGIALMITACCMGVPSTTKNILENFGRTVDVTEEYDQEIRSLDFSFRASKVIIQTGESFRVEADQVSKKFQTSVRDGVWIIREDGNSWLSSFFRNPEITITLPKDFLADHITLSIGAGEIKASILQAKKIEVEVGAGNLEIKQLLAESGDWSCGMGNMEITGKLTGSAELECGMGNVSLQLEGPAAQYNYQVEVGLGNAEIGQEKYSGIKDRHIDNQADKTIQVECGMGNVNIRFTQ